MSGRVHRGVPTEPILQAVAFGIRRAPIVLRPAALNAGAFPVEQHQPALIPLPRVTGTRYLMAEQYL